MKIFISCTYHWLVFIPLLVLLGSNSGLDTSPGILSFNNELSNAYTNLESFSESISDLFADFQYVISVDPTNTKAIDNDTCRPPEEKKRSVLCKSLDHALQISHGLSSVVVYLAAPGQTYPLNFTHNVMNQHNIWINGNSSLPSVIPAVKCLENVGLSFTNSSNISFSNVEFFNCGSVQNSTSKDFSKGTSGLHFLIVRVGLYFYNCTNISMYQVQVLNSSRAVGVVMYDTDGKVEICNSTFANNPIQPEDDSNQPGSGGFAVEFTYCKPGDSTCYDAYDPLYKRNQNSTYIFHNCMFQENLAINPALNHTYNIKVSKYNHDATDQGGGLSIHIKGNAKNNSFSLTNCGFFGNRAVWGGGLHIEMDDQSSNNSIFISGCNFSNNSVVAGLEQYDMYTGGGAISIITTVTFFNRLHVEHCRFTDNQALKGGAICFSTARQASDQLLDVFITDSLFESNRARLGSAMVITNFPIFTSGILPEIRICDCTFSSNQYAKKSFPTHPLGIAAVYVSEVPVSFQNSIRFDSNIGSALTAVGTQLNFTNTVAYFCNNSGIDGGAIALLGVAFILIGPNTDMTFVNNSADRHGGAIYNRYISTEHLKSTTDCFLRYSEPLTEPDNWTAQFMFSGNKAQISGCSIFTSSVIPCTWNFGFDLSKPYHWTNWHYDEANMKCKHSEIFTKPKTFLSSKSNWSLSDSIEVYSGHAFIIPLSAYDDLGNNVTDDTIYSAQMLDEHSKSVAKVERGFSYVASNYMKIVGKPENDVKLKLRTEGSRTMHVILNLTIVKCPLGFVCGENDAYCNSSDSIDQTKCQCPTEKYTYRDNLKCSTERFLSKISFKRWYGPIYIRESNTTLYLMGFIPFAYIDHSNVTSTIDLPKSDDELDERLCGGVHRKGVLCGECVEGYAVAVNSYQFECVPCDVNTTTTGEFIKFLCAYIVLTYVPIIVFFLLIVFLNIKLASSAAAGFVLYAQTISSGYHLYLLAPPGVANVIEIIQRTIYGLFNLESFAYLMEPFCLNKNFTTLHVICLDYAIAVLPLVMIVIIYILFKCKALSYKCNCRSRQRMIDPNMGSISSTKRSCCKKPSLIHAFTAFMLLSYTKFGLASMKPLFITELFDAEGITKDHRIFLAGHLSFSNHQFLFPFGILAILILVFVVFLPPLLLLGPLQFIDWLADKPKFRCIHKFWPSITIHTFLDAFQGYKPNRRFFAGLYLLFRLARAITYSFSQDFLSVYIIQLTIILIFIVLISLLRPYTNEKYNYLDMLLFLNLGILHLIAIYVQEREYIAIFYAVESTLVTLPLIYMICFIIWSKTRKWKHYKIVKENISRRLKNPVRSFGEETEQLLNNNDDDRFGESIDYSSDDPDEGMFQRAARGNRFRVASIETHPPRKPGGVHRSVVSIVDPQMPKIDHYEEEEEKNSRVEVKHY